MKTRIKITAIMFAVAAFWGIMFYSCKKDGPRTITPGAVYNIYLTDSPGNYQQVNVNIIGVQIRFDDGGWLSLKVNSGIYNLLNLVNGLDTLIATGQVGVGTVSQIRLILGTTGNTVMIDSVLYWLQTPSAMQSGLKVQVHSVLQAGVTYNIKLDFDAGRSVVATGNGDYILKPIIRAIVTPTSGAIKGKVYPYSLPSEVLAITGTDTVSTFTSTANGAYLVQGLAEGTYKVEILPPAPYSILTFNAVSVVDGQVTDMGIIQL